MIEYDLLGNLGMSKTEDLLARVLSHLAGTDELTLILMKDDELREHYGRLNALCERRRAKKSLKTKVEAFIKTLTKEELNEFNANSNNDIYQQPAYDDVLAEKIDDYKYGRDDKVAIIASAMKK